MTDLLMGIRNRIKTNDVYRPVTEDLDGKTLSPKGAGFD